jgi:acetyl/propionyl-CoA carboxylase alpha subunit
MAAPARRNRRRRPAARGHAPRALAEFEISGVPTVLPFHRAVVTDPAFAPEALTAAMNGVVVKVAVEEGQEVAVDSPVAVIEAMKMEQPVRAHRAGVVAQLQVEVGSVVAPGTTICIIR